MKILNKLVMTLAGLLLIAAAVLKFQEMLSICIPSWTDNKFGVWESYEFFLLQIPLEFALGVWMVSGLFRKAAWGVGTLAYLGFIGVTLTKAILGAESCGCFGQIHVNPWITLFIIDVPFFLLLAICRPTGAKLLPPPWPNAFYLPAIAVPTIGLMVLAAPALVALRPDCIKPEEIKTPTDQTQQKLKNYLQQQQPQQEVIEQPQPDVQLEPAEVVEPVPVEPEPTPEPAEPVQDVTEPAEPQPAPITEQQTAEPQPAEPAEPTEPAATDDEEPAAPETEQWEWLEFVVEEDVRGQLAQGLVTVLMYHHDCPVCAEMVPKYSDYCKQMAEQGNEAFKIAFLALPPYGEHGPVPADTTCILGTLTDQKNWAVMSPYVVALLDGELVKTWEQGTAPEPEKILEEIFGQ